MGIIVLFIILVVVLIVAAINQYLYFRDWLLWACIIAERYLGGGTGSMKLECVDTSSYEIFSGLRKIMPHKIFLRMVDRTLKDLEDIMLRLELMGVLTNIVALYDKDYERLIELLEKAKILLSLDKKRNTDM